ncbi:MAG: hypothetical protein V7L14_14030 [Nostoc sp.]|uniref:hypothetical protein n=1 Tax=Nostoc sp. TaxID=1180 RepID=UPI002FF473EC
MSKHYYLYFRRRRFSSPWSEKWVGESTGLFTSTSIDWQRARSPVCLIAHHKITALADGRGETLNKGIPV